jgi:putative heme iron utilization protein
MDPSHASDLRDLVTQQSIASLGTLHHGDPYVSMVPYALLPDGSGILIHVSQLSPHTRDMLTNPKVSLLVIAPPAADTPPAAVPRVTVQGDAAPLDETAVEYAAAKEAYLTRFPDSAMRFELADFSLFVIRPRTVRFIAGFAQAMSISPDAFAAALHGDSPSS